jgi:plastocyanin
MYSFRSFRFYRGLFFPLTVIGLIIIFTFAYNGCSKSDYSPNAYNNNPAPVTGANDVSIQGMSFVSGNKTVSTGTTITWTNLDAVAHTVTSGVPGTPSGVFDSGNISPNGTFSFTFNQAGVFKYYCKIHNSMTATITVQ